MELRFFCLFLVGLICVTSAKEARAIVVASSFKSLTPCNNHGSHQVSSGIVLLKTGITKDSTDRENDNDSIENPMTRFLNKEVGRYFKTLGLFLGTNKNALIEGEKVNNTRFNSGTNKRPAGYKNSKSDPIIEADIEPSSKLRPGKTKQIFGFHPHWMGKTYENYDFKLLSSIAYFAYELNPETGNYRGYKRIHDWDTTRLIKLAQKEGCKVYLTVTSFKGKDHRVFLKNQQARTNSIRIISNLLSKRQADGVVVNFEAVPKTLSELYTSYIINLSEELKKLGRTVIITLPPIPASVYNSRVLKDYVEFFIVMGKNYYVKQSDIAGPVAPLKSGLNWKNGSLEKSIKGYLKDGIPKDKIILSLPYYGSKWKTVDASIPSKNLEFNDYLKYETIKNKYQIKPQYDTVSQTAYLNVVENGDHYQIWFDDAKTLGEKYDFINEQDLAGVGIWALGYDNGYKNLWKVLQEKFNVSIEGDDESDTAENNDLPSWLLYLKNIKVLKALLYFMVLILYLGFLLSLRNYEVREIVFRRRWIKYVVLIGGPALVFLLIFSRSEEPKYGLFIFAGLLIGYLIYFFMNRTEDLDNNVNRVR